MRSWRSPLPGSKDRPEFSLISPTFGRPAEVEEFLDSLTALRGPSFEVILSDGSPLEDVEAVAQRFSNRLPLTFLYEKNIAVSPARNKAAAVASGTWLIFLDSDCLIPSDYLLAVQKGLKACPGDVFGGPDAAHPSFTLLQKAISHSMTSFLTTGGIRGCSVRTAAYRPRSFNMGIRRSAFDTVGGFSDLLCGEDIDLSIRLEKAGFKACFFPEAFVYHKRRTTGSKFFWQVFRFGAARVLLARRHRGELRLTHLFPVFFLWGLLGMLLAAFVWPKAAILLAGAYLAYFFAVGLEGAIRHRTARLFVLTIGTTCIQMVGYGCGFLANVWTVYIRGRTNGIRL